jgi:hypothetical protein
MPAETSGSAPTTPGQWRSGCHPIVGAFPATGRGPHGVSAHQCPFQVADRNPGQKHTILLLIRLADDRIHGQALIRR